MARKETNPKTGKQSEIEEKKARSINSSGVQLLRRGDVGTKCGLSRTTLYWMMKEGSEKYDPTFPKGFVIGDDPHNKKPKRWFESDVDHWILSQPRQGN